MHVDEEKYRGRFGELFQFEERDLSPDLVRRVSVIRLSEVKELQTSIGSKSTS